MIIRESRPRNSPQGSVMSGITASCINKVTDLLLPTPISDGGG